ncbi:M1 family metallopeptidase [Cytophaga aurantiaca]|uniref:M1 family metallopeptidase n=1 Tax=Cytophaga aurantiaca TaxID=29530 RepID=UPI0003749DE5|nr:M1 family metallopeptidase [Cytophaga aurantiaca]
MNFLRKPILLLAAVAAFYSCKQQATRSVESKPKTIQTSRGAYNPSTPLYWNLIHTKLEVSFDFAKQHLLGKATISLTPHYYSQNTLTLQAKGFDVHSIHYLHGAEIKTFTYDKKNITITLNKNYSRLDTLALVIDYTAKPNDLPKSGSDAITEEKGLYFIDPLGTDPHRPTQIWTQGETQSASCWFPTLDSPNQRSTQEMYITVDKKYTVISNGELVYKTEGANNQTTWCWEMKKAHAPYLFMMAVGEFAKVTDTWNGMEVSYYVEPEYEKYARNIFGETPAMIEFFSTKLNYPYPWPKYSQIVVRDFVSGAMENTSASIFMEALQVDDRFLVDDNWESIVSHELFHHWFGDLVTCESWSNLPLNESFANFSEIAWFEHKWGYEAGLKHAQEDLAGYLSEAETTQNPLIRYHYTDIEEMFDRHSYNKGGLVLNLLRNAVGEEAFYNSLHLYLVRNAYSPVEIDELRMAFEDVTGEDMHWFFDAWFMKRGHAQLLVEHHAGKKNTTEIIIEQKQDTTEGTIYRIPVQIDYRRKTDTTLHSKRYWISTYKDSITLPIPVDELLYLVVDSKHVVVGTVTHKKSVELLTNQFKYGTDYLIRQEAFEAIVQTDNAKDNPYVLHPETLITLQQALKDKSPEVRTVAVMEFTKHPMPNLETVFVPKFVDMAKNEPNGELRATVIQLLTSLGNNPAYLPIYKEGLNAPSYHVSGACLNALLLMNDTATIARIPEFESLSNSSIIASLAEFYTKTGDQTHYQWFENKMKQASDQDVYNLMVVFTKYVLQLGNEDKMKGSAFLKKISVENSHDVIRKNAKTYAQYIDKSIK